MSTNNEKLTPQAEIENDAFDKIHQEQSDILRQQHERAGENINDSAEETSERARAEAIETASRIDKEHARRENAPTPPPSRRHTISKRDLDKNYKHTMEHVQSQMSPQSRAFSKVIHNKGIEKTSDALGATIARPNAVLAGAIGAFVVTLALYLIAKNFGYRLSGSETIAGFVIGWVAGLLFDYLKVMITGKRS